MTGFVFTISNAYCMYKLVTTCNLHALKLQHSLEKDHTKTSLMKERDAFLQTILLTRALLLDNDTKNDANDDEKDANDDEKDANDDENDANDEEQPITKMYHKTTQTSSDVAIIVQDDDDSQYLPSSTSIILSEEPPPSRLATFFGSQ